MRHFLILLIFFQLLSCSNQVVQRTPAASSFSCKMAYQKLFGKTYNSNELLLYELKLNDELLSVGKNERLMEVVESDGLIDNQRKNKLIFALLKRDNPNLNTEELVKKFWYQFKKCS